MGRRRHLITQRGGHILHIANPELVIRYVLGLLENLDAEDSSGPELPDKPPVKKNKYGYTVIDSELSHVFSPRGR